MRKAVVNADPKEDVPEQHFFTSLLLVALVFSLCQPILAQPQQAPATTAVNRLLIAPDPINAKPIPKVPPWPPQCPAAPGIPPLRYLLVG